MLFEDGDGVEKDLEKAKSWYQKAADQGNAKAETNLGNIYYDEKEYRDMSRKMLQKYDEHSEKVAEEQLDEAISISRSSVKILRRSTKQMSLANPKKALTFSILHPII